MRKILHAAVAAILMLSQILTVQLASAAPTLIVLQSSSADLYDEATKGFLPSFGNIDEIAGNLWDTYGTRENAVAGAVIGVAAGVLAVVVFAPAAITVAAGATIAALTSELAVTTAAGLYIGGLAIYDDAKQRAAEKAAEAQKIAAAQQVQEEQYAYSQASRDRDKGRIVEADRDHANLMRSAIEAEMAGLRVETGEGFDRNFSGQTEDGSLTYSGTRIGGRVSGSYVSREDDQVYNGQFIGQIQRNGSVSGTYVEGSEVGSFSGQASPSLNAIFSGGARCDSGCE